MTTGLDRDTPIYRFVPWRWIRDLLVDENLALVRPENWDDPYELINRPIQVDVIDGRGARARKILDGSNFEVFSMSWTTKDMADTMLRAYSKLSPAKGEVDIFDLAAHANEAVQISTTVGKLHDAIAHSLKNTPSFERLYLSKVEYVSDSLLSRRVGGIYANGPDFGKTSDCVASLLSLKRDAYEAEQEIRPIVLLNDAAKDVSVLKVKINPRELIDSISIDPRLRSSKVSGFQMQAYHNRLVVIRDWGFGSKIRESHLYSASPMFESILEIDSPNVYLDEDAKARWRAFLTQHQMNV